MRKLLLAVVSPLLLLATSMSSQAQTDLTGTWVGQFKGVYINVPQVQPGMFSSRSYEARRKTGPEFLENPLTVVIEAQQEDTMHGQWSIQSGEGSRRGGAFVCALTDPNNWTCVDVEGTTDVEILSANEMKVCHFASSSDGQGAGCGVLKKQ